MAQAWTAANPWQVERVARAVPTGPRRGSEGGAHILPSPSPQCRWDKASASPAPSSLPRRRGAPLRPFRAGRAARDATRRPEMAVRFLFVLLFWVQSQNMSCSSSPLTIQEKRRPRERGTGRRLDRSLTLASQARYPRRPCGPITSPPRERGGRAVPAVPGRPKPLGQGEHVVCPVLITAPLRTALATLRGQPSSTGRHTTTGDFRPAGTVTVAARRRCPRRAPPG